MLFRIPNIVGAQYAPGPQPNDPGNSVKLWAGHMGLRLCPLPWPGPVPVINALANNSGTPHMRAPVPVVNAYSPLLVEALFIGGINGKSQG